MVEKGKVDEDGREMTGEGVMKEDGEDLSFYFYMELTSVFYHGNASADKVVALHVRGHTGHCRGQPASQTHRQTHQQTDTQACV